MRPSTGVWLFGLMAAAATWAGCAPAVRPASAPVTTPAPPAEAVVLVSLDAFRADYLDRYAAPRLRSIGDAGIRAQALLPVFPTKTFPNHWTLVTGLTAEHHGIVANRMFDEAFGQTFVRGEPAEFDGRWWGGEPVWNTVQKTNRKAATMFWPGSAADVGGMRPSYWRPFDATVSNQARVEQVVTWLLLPPAERPSVDVVYIGTVDEVGHRNGPETIETGQAVADVDRAVGVLVDQLAKHGLTARTNLVVVSDHGMVATSPGRVLFLDDYLNLDTVDIVDLTPVLAIRAKDGNHERVYQALRDKHPALKVYRRQSVPARFRFSDNPRITPVVGIADEGWVIDRSRASPNPYWRETRGEHGYDNRLPSMAGILLAQGPGFARGVRLPALDNVNVYALLCHLLGLEPAPNDGSLDAFRPALKGASVPGVF